MFAFELYAAITTQYWTAAMAAVITVVGLWLMSNSYGAGAGWGFALIVVLCLVAFFPNGYHSIFNTGQSYSIGGGVYTTDYSAKFTADVLYAISGGIIGSIIRWFQTR